MTNRTANAETVFARALELAAGVTRNQFVAEQCSHDPALRREVESLLGAHEQAADFLVAGAKPEEKTSNLPRAISPRGTVIMNAAAYAESFLQHGLEQDVGQIEVYIMSLPEA